MNKGYIKVVLALLSVAGYMQNAAFASEYDPIAFPQNEKFRETIETREAVYTAGEALKVAKKHAEDLDGYELYYEKDRGAVLYFKRVNNTEIGMFDLIIPNPNSYDDIVDMLWDSNGEKNFDDSFINGFVSKKYKPNLLIRQQLYQSAIGSLQRYYNALANKVELSEDETAIVIVSSDMNDHVGGSNSEYVNPIVEGANSFKPDISSQKDIQNRELYKIYANLVAFFIKKEAGYVKITHISSIDHNVIPGTTPETIRAMTAQKMLNIAKLRNIFKNKKPASSCAI
ncbi:fam-a protein [Plasmodium vinckei]|uniref:Fam-a protein n=1 Tax=Plasmodium vinckei TaxID=5860 RepID=A0A6V7S9K7_PLAVN|nr:fam-a protein [Plasmodium vinckei]